MRSPSKAHLRPEIDADLLLALAVPRSCNRIRMRNKTALIALASTNSRLMRNWCFDNKMEHKFEHDSFGSLVFVERVIRTKTFSKLVLKFVFNFVWSLLVGARACQKTGDHYESMRPRVACETRPRGL